MLPTPSRYFLTAGSAEGEMPLTAFDGALLAAGIGDVNLVRVSSILPPGARPLIQLNLPAGALVPIAYGYNCSDQPGRRIAAAVGVGIGADDEPGVIVEHSGPGAAADMADIVRLMVREAFTGRGRPEPADIVVRSTEHVVRRVGCAFAGLVLWYD